MITELGYKIFEAARNLGVNVSELVAQATHKDHSGTCPSSGKTVHLGHEKHGAIAIKGENTRNGKTGKTVKGGFGNMPIEVPRAFKILCQLTEN